MSGATYLIKSKEYLRKLTDDIEQLYAKQKPFCLKKMACHLRMILRGKT